MWGRAYHNTAGGSSIARLGLSSAKFHMRNFLGSLENVLWQLVRLSEPSPTVPHCVDAHGQDQPNLQPLSNHRNNTDSEGQSVAIPTAIAEQQILDVGKSASPVLTHPAPSFKSNLFALIIGINDYINLPKLCGAVADAKAMKEHLKEFRGVAEDHIRILLDGQATRDAVREEFEHLRDNSRINVGDPILIYYAGHGGELPVPSAWGALGLENKMIQCIIPQDYEPRTNPAIPDRTIGVLIENIAKEKGDNITVIFDCCHSASGTRKLKEANEGYIIRGVELRADSLQVVADLDRDLWKGRAGGIAPGFAHYCLRSHVLLAACGEKEWAYEPGGRGAFTTALLETLERFSAEELTYAQVFERMKPLDRQNPQCEGVNRHRVLFGTRVPPGRHANYSVRIDGSNFIIGAGSAHGVSRGVEFTLYSDRKLQLGVLVVDDTARIKHFETILATSTLHTEPSFAKLTRVGELAVRLASGGDSDTSSLNKILRRIGGNDINVPKFRLVERAEDAKLGLAMEKDQVVVKLLDPRLRRFASTEFSFKTPLSNVVHVLDAAAHFYWYLDHMKKEDAFGINGNAVTVDFNLLEESLDDYDDSGAPLLVPIEPGFCRKAPDNSHVIDFQVVPGGLYGIKITNNTQRNLYLNAFLFNNDDLSIAPYYTQPSVLKPEAPLKQGGTFTIGYGPGGLPPFSYSLIDGRDVDVGYLKIFLATRSIDLSDIELMSPFSSMNPPPSAKNDARAARPVCVERKGGADGVWGTMTIMLVQRRMLVTEQVIV